MTSQRLPDCSVLDALCHQVKMPLADFIAACDEHARSGCAECAAIEASDALEVLEREPVCACRMDGDRYDPRGCEAHGKAA